MNTIGKLLGRIRKHNHRAASIKAFMTEEESLRLQARQARSIMRMTPWTILLNIVISLALFMVARNHVPEGSLFLWSGVNIAISILVLIHWRLAASHCLNKNCAARYIFSVRIQGILLGATWAALPLSFFAEAPHDLRVLIASMTLGAFSLGSFRMAQAPLAALAYISIPAAALGYSAYTNLSSPIGLAYAVMVIVYASALSLIVYMRYQDTLRMARSTAELERRKNIIKLLLNDFENGASDWLWETGTSGEITYASRRLQDLLGLPGGKITGTPLHELLGCRENDGEWKRFFTDTLIGKPIENIVLPAKIRGKDYWFRMNARPLFDDEGVFRGYRGVASDITAQHLHEQRLRRDKEAAENESRAKSNFLAVISHELRTPLNAMVGFSEMLVNEAFGPLNEKYKEFSSHIHEGSRQLEMLINDILDYTRFERNKIKLIEQEVDLVELADIALRQIRMDARAQGLELKLDAPDTLTVRGDMGRLRQVLSNLLVNAVKFTNEGSVRVRIAREEDGGVRVSVIDTGIGISEQDMERIFEPFCQADGSLSRRHDGIGLGLAIARSLMRLHGGNLILESQPGKGCTASFTLPASRVIEDEDDTGAMAA